MARFHTILGPVDPESRTVFAEAGAPLGRVEAAASAYGLFFPPLPSSAEWCTVGGAVANNAAGARTFGYGAVRDWVESVSVVLADGTPVTLELGAEGSRPPVFGELYDTLADRTARLLQDWPRVRKNSSGYVIDRFLKTGDPVPLLVGSEGTLGIITGARLRLAPLPDSRGLAVLAVPSLDDVVRVRDLAHRLNGAACEFFGRRYVELLGPEVRDVVPKGATAVVLVELDGAPDRVLEGLEALAKLGTAVGGQFTSAADAVERERLWSLRKRASPAIARVAGTNLRSTQFIEDSVVPPNRLPDYVRGVETLMQEVGFDGVVFGHAGDGNAHVNPLVPYTEPDWRARVRHVLEGTVDLVASLGGTLAGEHGDGRVRAPYLDRIWSAESVDAFRTVKRRLDPDGILNPGVILPLPGQDPLEGLGAAWPTTGEAA
jgi:FAD/FMN-containing dehydrogenase